MWHSLDVALPHSVRGRFAKSTPVDTMGKKPSRSRASAAAPLLQAVKAEAETSDDGFRSTRRKSGGETSATESKSKKSKNVGISVVVGSSHWLVRVGRVGSPGGRWSKGKHCSLQANMRSR